MSELNYIIRHPVDVQRVRKLVGMGEKSYTFGVRSIMSRETVFL